MEAAASILLPDSVSLILRMDEEAIRLDFVVVELLWKAVMRDSSMILLVVGVPGVHRGEIDGCPILGCEAIVSTQMYSSV